MIYGEDNVENIDALISTPFVWSELTNIMQATSHKICVKFALFQLENIRSIMKISGYKTQHYNIDIADIISPIKAWIDDSCYDNLIRVHGVLGDSFMDLIQHTLYSIVRADTAEASSVHAALTAVRMLHQYKKTFIEQYKQEQMNYLRNLILENLTEEQKDNWLLVASL